MPILADQHMHSSFSADSKSPLKDMIEGALKKGLVHVNITEHNDFNFPSNPWYPDHAWDLNVDSYLYDLLCLREEYQEKINIGFGIEIGMQESCLKENYAISNSQPFDFIIGSIHIVNGVDTYDPKYYEGKTTKQAIDEYFENMLRNIKQFKNFDVLGHLDYVTRTLPEGEDAYNPMDYKNFIDEVLTFLIENGKGLEINTSAVWKKGNKNANPHLDILKMYKEKGGEIITVGSDAHEPTVIAGAFDFAEQLLKDAGFEYYSVFTHRLPMQMKL